MSINQFYQFESKIICKPDFFKSLGHHSFANCAIKLNNYQNVKTIIKIHLLSNKTRVKKLNITCLRFVFKKLNYIAIDFLSKIISGKPEIFSERLNTANL